MCFLCKKYMYIRHGPLGPPTVYSFWTYLTYTCVYKCIYIERFVGLQDEIQIGGRDSQQSLDVPVFAVER